MGMVNKVVPHDQLENTAFHWAQEIMLKSPTAIKMLKFGFTCIDTKIFFELLRVATVGDRVLPARAG